MNRLEGVRILVVDDDPDVLDGIDLALRSEGATTLRANDGNEAVMLWRKEAPEAVVLDMMLPKRSGFLVLEELIEAENPPVVVMVTANEGKRHMSYAKSMGVHAYLNKPVPLETLIQTIYDLLKEGNRPASE
ncbi:MAG: response regulator [Phycisphaerales bacterium]|jgi:CheY-like chemotaxis protein|nr:response regulator [Phycisphaerales bacterium]|tara:strand:- start:13383 stop:13778 length:396 start_codon:yes stop_codon:yes gene_type:complete